MKIKNLEINKEKVFDFFTKVVCADGVVVTCVCMQNLYKKIIKGVKDTNNINTQEELSTDNSKKELVLNGITYVAPSGCELEVINDQVWAVRSNRLYKEPMVMHDKNGKDILIAPIGYTLDGETAYCDADEFIEPIIKR